MTDEGGIHAIISRAVPVLRTDDIYGPRVCNCWLPAATFAQAMVKSGHIDASLIVDAKKFNIAMSKSNLFGECMTHFDGSNKSGIFRIYYRRQYFYYFTDPGRQVAYPSPLNGAWKERVLIAGVNALAIPSTRARPAASTTAGSTPAADDAAAIKTLDENESPNKRQRLDFSAGSSCSYWPESPEAHQLFLPRQNGCGTGVLSGSDDGIGEMIPVVVESPQEAVERRIKLLKSCHDSEDSWRNVVKGRDADNFCSKVEIFEIRQRATFLCLAYQLALANMNRWTWQDCCQEACKTLNSLGMYKATFYKTVAEWNMVFRRIECFPHPNPYVQCGKRPLPRLLEIFPNAKDLIVGYGVKHLATLTIEGIHDFIVNTVIPRLAAEWQSDKMKDDGNNVDPIGTASTTTTSTTSTRDNESDINEQFLQAHRLASMSFTTVWRWMRLLGFRYDVRRKSFYVDGHERDDVVATRTQFCKSYLTELEPYCKRWIQVSMKDATTINDLDIGLGHTYFNIVKNEHMIEYHIDYWNLLKERNGTTIEAQATTSIRVSSKPRPIMIIGQDESVFAQYLLGSKTWIGPSGQRPLLPKSEGDGYMLSAFVSREIGFGREMTDDELLKVNTARRGAGKTYHDTQAAIEILGTADKAILTESPFVKYLYIGASNEGYWNSYYMSLQFEDVVDCLQVLYPDYDLVFMFDHSQGHARKRHGALSAQNMSKTYGGAQAMMRDTTVTAEEGFLGPHLPLLRVGDTQCMAFKSTDIGPLYLTAEQQQLQRHDRATGKSKLVERSKKILLEQRVALQQQGYTKKELQNFARNNAIELYERKEHVLPGWEG